MTPFNHFTTSRIAVSISIYNATGRLQLKASDVVYRHTARLVRRVIGPSQGLYLHKTTETVKVVHFHALSGMRTHNPSVLAAWDST